MTATMTLALVQIVVGVVGLVMLAIRTGYSFQPPLQWMIAFALATVAGGAMIRICRSASMRPRSATN